MHFHLQVDAGMAEGADHGVGAYAPVVRYIERRMRLPRTAAILLLYLAAAGIFAAASAYSIGKTLVGVDKVMIRIAGGWQEIPGGPVNPEVSTGGSETALRIY